MQTGPVKVPAVVDPFGTWSREEITAAALSTATDLRAVLADTPQQNSAGTASDVGPRIALLCEAGSAFLTALLAVWEAGAVAVPLHPDHPDRELAALAHDAGVSAVLCSERRSRIAARLAEDASVPVVRVDRHLHTARGAVPSEPTDGLHAKPPDEAALMVFTSGTTGRPKGVLHTHGSIGAQVQALLEPWGWRSDDRTLLVLPLHHVHGIMAVVLCAWAAGATCEAPGGFDPLATWDRLGSGEITVFMAVPTIYHRLIAAWDEADDSTRTRWSDGASRVRLMVSGSAALPTSVLDRWRELTGHTLLERYGMTEFGLALSNTLDHRTPGHVGYPLPGFEVRTVDDDGDEITPDRSDEPGGLQVRGQAMFRSYWDRPVETESAFTADGWFRTGDVAVLDTDGYRLLGRSSVDIIKTGGEKVSAIEIEEVFRLHPAIGDCAVVGVPDEEWGQRVALMATRSPQWAVPSPGTADLRSWGKERLPPAKVPVLFTFVEELPRNAMGKVTKAVVIDQLTTAPR